jgi:ATP-dependent DNA helicase RecQ
MALEVTWENHPPEKLLKERFHISTGFHPEQRDIIEQLVRGKQCRRLLVIQRTGWGKSLCYQMASLYYPHLTIVFSPLKALMRDQCQRCNDVYDIPAAIVSSDFSPEENRATLDQARAGLFKILFISPERLDNADWQAYVLKMRISMIVVDEAHCISTWGHDFRPHYRRIVRLLNALPDYTPVLALTATASRRVEQDVLEQIGTEAQMIRGSMQRPNLYLDVVRLWGNEGKLSFLGDLLPRIPGTGIIYTATKHDAEMVATFLSSQNISCEHYHGGREDALRQDIEQKLMANQYKAVCATNALGMGIDKPDLRFVIHYHVPASPIHYYQEIGRAGRDGKVAWCILLYDPTDVTIQQHFIRNAKPEGRFYEVILQHLRKDSLGLHDLMRVTGFVQASVQAVLMDLEEQGLVERDPKDRTYSATLRLEHVGGVDFSDYDTVRRQKERELNDMQNYAQNVKCYMEYLTTYLGDESGYVCRKCGRCRPSNFPLVKPTIRMQEAVAFFLEEGFLPRIEKRGTERRPIHEAGWSLSYHVKSRTGKLVRASKYEDGGPFPSGLITRAVEVLRSRYPISAINGIVSVPPTKSGMLVEVFAQQVAAELGVDYLDVLEKVRVTQEQKLLSNWLQKSDNVKGAFVVHPSGSVEGKTLLLIDDIYDSGYMIREVALTLMQAGVKAVYPFTITRTAHSDDR